MNTSVSWNSSGSRVLGVPTQAKWQEVARGLRFLTVGYFLLFTLIAAGAVLQSPARGWWRLPELLPSEREDLATFGLLLGAIGAVFCGLLTLVGQWLCLRYAPQDHCAKELVFTSFLAGLVAAPLACAAPFLEELWNGQALESLLDSLQLRAAPSVVVVLLVTFFVMALINLLAFSHFARVVAIRFENQMLNNSVVFFFLYVCVLLGGSAGSIIALRQFPSQPFLLVGPAVGWGLCLPWHSLVVVGAMRVVNRGLRRSPSGGGRNDGGTRKPYSGVHRVFTTPKIDVP